MDRQSKWLISVIVVVAVGYGVLQYWLNRNVEVAREQYDFVKALRAKQEDWKVRWAKQYDEYKRLKEAKQDIPGPLATDLTLLLLERIGEGYERVSILDAKAVSKQELDPYISEKAWLSFRDQKPFDVVWGVDLANLSLKQQQSLLAWEAEGSADGQRCVLFADGTVKLIDRREFDQTAKVKGK
jgi:hypothetical protein